MTHRFHILVDAAPQQYQRTRLGYLAGDLYQRRKMDLLNALVGQVVRPVKWPVLTWTRRMLHHDD